MEDESLVRALLDGEPDAWDVLVERHSGLVAAVVRRILRARGLRAAASDVDDIVENTFVALLERDGALLRAYDREHKLATYLGVIARTQAHRWLRSRKPGAELPDDVWKEGLADAGAVAAPDELVREEAIASVRAALETLNERERLILKLFYFEGADYKTIAERLSVSVNTIGSLLTRARARLEAVVRERTDPSG